MKPVRLMSAGVLLLFLGAVAPTYARQDDAKPPKQEQQAKPEKQQEAKPEKQQEQAKPEKQQERANPEKQQEAKPVKPQEAKPAKQQQPAKTQLKQVKATRQDQPQQAKSQPQGQWAHNGQKDSRGHVYNESRFGRDHHTRFVANGGRMYNGRREYSYGGYWFYAGVYPPWFYQQDVYFIMGANGLWYAVAYGDPSLTFQVDIE